MVKNGQPEWLLIMVGCGQWQCWLIGVNSWSKTHGGYCTSEVPTTMNHNRTGALCYRKCWFPIASAPTEKAWPAIMKTWCFIPVTQLRIRKTLGYSAGMVQMNQAGWSIKLAGSRIPGHIKFPSSTLRILPFLRGCLGRNAGIARESPWTMDGSESIYPPAIMAMESHHFQPWQIHKQEKHIISITINHLNITVTYLNH